MTTLSPKRTMDYEDWLEPSPKDESSPKELLESAAQSMGMFLELLRDLNDTKNHKLGRLAYEEKCLEMLDGRNGIFFITSESVIDPTINSDSRTDYELDLDGAPLLNITFSEEAQKTFVVTINEDNKIVFLPLDVYQGDIEVTIAE